MMTNKTILITGASGFVGKQLVKTLANKQNLSLRLALRTKLQSTSFDAQIAVFPSLDLAEDSNWRVALEGCDTVIHTAGLAHVLQKKNSQALNELRKINTLGTMHLARQAAELGVKRFIFLSSIGVNGNSTAEHQVFKSTDRPNPQTAYAVSKYEAELALQELALATGMEVVIIRPPLVYGAEAKGNFHRLIRWLKKGIPLPLASIPNKRSFVSIDNLISLILVCLDHPAAANKIFLVSDGEDLSTTSLLQKMNQKMKNRTTLFPVPQALLTFAAKILGRTADLERLCGSLVIDMQDTCDSLNWKPECKMDEVLDRIIKNQNTF